MSQQAETKFKEKVIAHLKGLNSGRNVWFLKTQEVATRGVPDILMCVGGWFVALELKKSSTDVPDPLQQYNLQQVKQAGGYSFWVHPDNWVKVRKEIKKLTLKRRPKE